MPVQLKAYHTLLTQLPPQVTLVAVSKTKPVSDILALYEQGQRDFGENYVQELLEKQPQLPGDIRWHFIGHLQSNKVKYLAPFVHLIHGVDSFSLLKEIQKQGVKVNRRLDCLLQVHIAKEETKFGMDEAEVLQTLQQASFTNAHVKGLMGMGTNGVDEQTQRAEFEGLKAMFDKCRSIEAGGQRANLGALGPDMGVLAADMGALGPEIDTLSMGMSGDYQLAIACGSTMVRVGSLLFGGR
jgi:pyridoxal phosphate enzyme (YggS family)